jgi:hypothetical protein
LPLQNASKSCNASFPKKKNHTHIFCAQLSRDAHPPLLTKRSDRGDRGTPRWVSRAASRADDVHQQKHFTHFFEEKTARQKAPNANEMSFVGGSLPADSAGGSIAASAEDVGGGGGGGGVVGSGAHVNLVVTGGIANTAAPGSQPPLIAGDSAQQQQQQQPFDEASWGAPPQQHGAVHAHHIAAAPAHSHGGGGGGVAQPAHSMQNSVFTVGLALPTHSIFCSRQSTVQLMTAGGSM